MRVGAQMKILKRKKISIIVLGIKIISCSFVKVEVVREELNVLYVAYSHAFMKVE